MGFRADFIDSHTVRGTTLAQVLFTDPLVLIGSPFGFDFTFSSTGTYGESAFCFAKNASTPPLGSNP